MGDVPLAQGRATCYGMLQHILRHRPILRRKRRNIPHGAARYTGSSVNATSRL